MCAAGAASHAAAEKENAPLARPYRIGLLIVSGSLYYRSVGAAIGRAVGDRKAWSVRLAGDMGGEPAAMFAWRPDGVITNITPENPFVDRLRDLGIPLVSFAGALPDGDVPTVRSDDRQIADTAARYLLERNLKHFAYWTDRPMAYIERRRDGFFAALGDRGVPPDCLHALPPFDASDWRRRDRTVSRWLLDLPKPVGLLAGLALQAYYLCGICRDAGLDVPNEVALLGVDNDPLVCEMADPPLSSIELATERIGRTAVEMLADLLDGCAPPVGPVLVPPLGVVSRGSTDMLAVDDPDLVAAVRYIRECATRGIGVSNVLAAVPVSRRRLERRFRSVFGRSPMAEIRRVQIERARYLLASSEATVAEVARAAGFANADYFTTVFGRQVGLSPTQYRRRGRAGGQ